jgi:hypothetical protein
VEEQDELAIKVFIIPEQKFGVVVSQGAFMSTIKYHDGFEEIIEPFDNNDFIISDEIIVNIYGED